MRLRIRCLIVTTFLALPTALFALDLSDPYSTLSEIFSPLIDENEGVTTFRSLLIPGGGRAEAMGMAFTALANDISFFETNPAASSTITNTELAVFHNNWIGDSRLETLSYTQRGDNLGYGASLRCFYVDFTETNTFGKRASANYYTETLATLNVAYNFLSGYYFKGIAVGANLKAGYRGMPNYTDNYGTIVSSGSYQSAFAIMGDVGLQTRFNLFKLYQSREPNAFVGLTFRNFGPPVLDEPLPSVISAGGAWKPVNPVIISAEFQQPVNLVDLAQSGKQVYGAGVSVEFATFLTLLGGFQLKGGNPRLSLGGEMDVNDLQANVTYTLDMTTQAKFMNRITLSLKLDLGDRGRGDRRKAVESKYVKGLKLYAAGDLEGAIALWTETLAMDKTFDPAREGIETAVMTQEIQRQIKQLQQIE